MINAIAPSVSMKNRLIKDSDWMTSRLQGKVGGAENMEIFAEPNDWNLVQSECNAFHEARNPGTGVKYDYNPNLWCSDLLPQLTGCYAAMKWQGATWMSIYGTTLITPQHVVSCVHSGTPHLNTQYRWIDADGYAVDNTVISKCLGYGDWGSWNDNNEFTDISVGLLATPMPAGVRPFRIAPPRFTPPRVVRFARSQAYTAGADGSPSRPPYTQETWPDSFKYPRQNKAMYHIIDTARVQNPRDWNYWVWPGDSGTPIFSLADDEVLMTGMVGSNQFTGFFNPSWNPPVSATEYLNRLIAVANERAISQNLVESVNPAYVAQEASEYA